MAALSGSSVGELQAWVSIDQRATQEITYRFERGGSHLCSGGLGALLSQDQPQEVRGGGGVGGASIDAGTGAGGEQPALLQILNGGALRTRKLQSGCSGGGIVVAIGGIGDDGSRVGITQDVQTLVAPVKLAGDLRLISATQAPSQQQHTVWHGLRWPFTQLRHLVLGLSQVRLHFAMFTKQRVQVTMRGSGASGARLAASHTQSGAFLRAFLPTPFGLVYTTILEACEDGAYDG